MALRFDVVVCSNWELKSSPDLVFAIRIIWSSHFVNGKIKCKKLRCNLLHIMFVCHFITSLSNQTVFRCDSHRCSGSKQWRGQNSAVASREKVHVSRFGAQLIWQHGQPMFGSSGSKICNATFWMFLISICLESIELFGLQKWCFFHHLWPYCNSIPNLWWTHGTPWGIGINIEQGKHTAWIMRTSCVFPCWEVFRNDGREEKEFAGGDTATQGQGLPFFRGSRILVPKGCQFS